MPKVLPWLLFALGMALLSGPASACSMVPPGERRLSPDALVFEGIIQGALEVASVGMLDVRVTRPVRGVEQGDLVRLMPLDTETDCSPLPLTTAELAALWPQGKVVSVIGRPLTLPLDDRALVVEVWEGNGGCMSEQRRAPAVDPMGMFSEGIFTFIEPSTNTTAISRRLPL